MDNHDQRGVEMPEVASRGRGCARKELLMKEKEWNRHRVIGA